MTALVRVPGLADSLADLFAPVDEGPIAALLAEHAERRATIERVAAVFADADAIRVLEYFADGASLPGENSSLVMRMFGGKYAGKAYKALDAEYWGRALAATDVLACMPAERRNEWFEQIKSFDVPEFTADALRSTLAEQLAARAGYFAERVDGLFSALSPAHVTNSPAGFGGKLIIADMVDEIGILNQYRVPLLVDLRVIVARFMGRTDIGEGGHIVDMLTRNLVRDARHECCGEWVTVDGGAIEIKLHKAGTCHVRLHPEIVWRLNAVLASVHPGAIPESARTRPKRGSVKKARTVELMTRPLPFAVVRVLATYNQRSRGLGPNDWEYGFGFDKLDKHVRAEVVAVLASIGGVMLPESWSGQVRFDFDADEVLRELVASGCVPDQRAHQYYPTPRTLAERVVELAQIGPDDVVLEPSAGQGAIAELLPRERTVCVEASALHVAVLKARGFVTVHGDFLRQAGVTFGVYASPNPTRVVMNPPFDRGQWAAHVEHAAKMLSPRRGARLVAILPASAAKRLTLPGFTLSWSEPIEGAFPGVSIAVVILVAEREA